MAIELDDLQIDIVVNADKAATAIKDVADALKKAGTSTKAIKKLSEALSETATASAAAAGGAKDLGTATAEVSVSAEKSTNNFKAMVTVLKAAGNGAKALGSGIKGVVSSGFSKISNLLSSIKRVAFYRLIRSAIKLITSALSEGVKMLIAWDREWGNNSSLAAQTADTINAKWAEVKKSLGAAAMPLIQVLQPALMSVMNTVIQVANTINMVLRSLQGYGTYMKATMQAAGDGIQAATGRAKELKRVLFGFDELNILPSDTASGGGASSSATSPVDFVETAIDDNAVAKFNDILDIVKAIGAGFLTWKVGSTFLKGLGLADEKAKGLGIALAGAVTAGFALADQLSDGVTWGNAATLMAGVAAMVVGLNNAFGKTGAAIGLMVGGVVGLIAPLKELIQTGELTTQSFVQLEASIAAVGVGLGLLTGSWIPAVVGLGIAGLIAAVTYEAKRLKDAQDALEIEKYGDTIANLTGRIDEQTQAFKDRREAITNSQPKEEAELKLADDLMRKYQGLKSESYLTAEGKERLVALSQELIKIYPDLNKYINEENGLLDISAGQWAEIYEAKMKDIKLEARREKLIELYKLQVDQELELAKATEDVTNAEKVLNDARSRKENLPAYIEKMQLLLGKVNLSEKGVDALTRSEKKMFAELTGGTMSTQDAMNAIIDLQKEYANADKTIKTATENYIKVDSALKLLQEDYTKTGTTIDRVSAGMYDDVHSSTTSMVKDVEAAAPKVLKSMEQIQKDLSGKHWWIKVSPDTTGLANSVAYIYGQLQKSLSKAPLVMQVTSNQVGVSNGLANSRQATIAATKFASGGVPDIGTLFYAGEAGAEVVANMNGRTQVLNTDQMSDAIASGNVDVVNAIYALMNTMVSTVNGKSFDIYMDSAKVGRSVSTYQNNQARRGITQGAY